MNLEEKLYTSTEVAQILGVSLRSVYRYLEENKLDAEVKTATGRHRFTKQNILDFLYPNKDNMPKDTQNIPTQPEPKQQKIKKEEKAEEPVDWLARFREAANKFKTEEAANTVQPEPAVATPSVPEPELVEPIAPVAPKDTVTGLGDFSFVSEPSQEQAVEEKEPDSSDHYYRSMLGGLKEIAQNIDKSARKASVDYAFTLNAGLSLHKPIKPFSVLHVYIKSQDKDLFEKMLQLVPSDKDTAQVCLRISNKDSTYSGKKELHGLYVVSNMQLKADLLEAGEEELAKELDQDFPF